MPLSLALVISIAIGTVQIVIGILALLQGRARDRGVRIRCHSSILKIMMLS